MLIKPYKLDISCYIHGHFNSIGKLLVRSLDE